MDTQQQLATKMAVNYYLTVMKKSNLVTPSLGRPFPRDANNEEQMEIHKGLMKIHTKRMLQLRQEINELKRNGSRYCEKTFTKSKERFKRKIDFLKEKHKPIITEHARRRPQIQNKEAKNRKARERYKARQVKGKIKRYNDNVENGIRTVINLSSYDMPMAEIFALELGYGFVPTPAKIQAEEDLLILEGLRFVDRIGKLDVKLRAELQQQQNSQTSSQDGRTTEPEEPREQQQHQPQQPIVTDPLETDATHFVRSKEVPHSLQFSNPKEELLQIRDTKLLKKEFDEFNINLINKFREKKKKHNLPKKIREALHNLKKQVSEKRIDIRKVDKGQMIMVIDYDQRVKAETLRIEEIATPAANQQLNWKENKEFIELKMKELYKNGFISNRELTAVTGILPGGASGELKNSDGSMKYTRIKENNELFARQSTPYVYPLFKLHKLPMETILQLQPNEVAEKVPSRLVVGMTNCQLSRVQCWLETFLTPLATKYGSFEYIKDSTDMLWNLEEKKRELSTEETIWNDVLLYTIDVKALYPSVKFPYLFDSLKDCFKTCTEWTNHQI